MGYISTFPLKDPSFGRMKQKSLMLDEYRYLYNNMKLTIPPNRINNLIDKIKENENRYRYVSSKLKYCQWQIVAIIHALEANLNFNSHISNGDPLTSKTKNHPKDRPLTGSPPYTWEESAIDILEERFKSADKFMSPCEILYFLELYNGNGYRKVNYKINILGENIQILTPYLWSGTNWYIKGKFSSDGKFDQNLVSKQIGAAVLLSKLI